MLFLKTVLKSILVSSWEGLGRVWGGFGQGLGRVWRLLGRSWAVFRWHFFALVCGIVSKRALGVDFGPLGPGFGRVLGGFWGGFARFFNGFSLLFFGFLFRSFALLFSFGFGFALRFFRSLPFSVCFLAFAFRIEVLRFPVLACHYKYLSGWQAEPALYGAIISETSSHRTGAKDIRGYKICCIKCVVQNMLH